MEVGVGKTRWGLLAKIGCGIPLVGFGLLLVLAVFLRAIGEIDDPPAAPGEVRAQATPKLQAPKPLEHPAPAPANWGLRAALAEVEAAENDLYREFGPPLEQRRAELARLRAAWQAVADLGLNDSGIAAQTVEFLDEVRDEPVEKQREDLKMFVGFNSKAYRDAYSERL